MATQVVFNPLTYIDRLTRGGFTPEQARASAEALETALGESVATKGDVLDAKHELKLEISQSKNDVLRWVFAFNLAMIGAIFAIVKFVH